MPIAIALASLHCGGPTASESSNSQPGGGTAPSPCTKDNRCAPSDIKASESDWHPDSDGDGVPTKRDLCPYVFDPKQGDADGDKRGDLCDLDFRRLVAGGPVVDLHAQHVTPYGGWFSFRSPKTTRYGQDYVLAWSKKPSDLSSGRSIRRLPAEQRRVFRVHEYEGEQVYRPQIIHSMHPSTSYHLVVTPLDDNDKPTDKIGNMLEITTLPAVQHELAGTGPRVWASTKDIAALKKRASKEDQSFQTWSKLMAPIVVNAASSNTRYDYGACISAALLYHGTGQKKFKTAALTLIKSMTRYWQDNQLERNQLRWADSLLAICSDLMWQELSNGERNQIVAAYLDDDEKADIERIIDTDQYASIIRTWIVDGAVGCQAEGVRADLSKRACDLLERGKRAFIGVQLVKARRERGFFAQAGGSLPDGSGYGTGTTSYWLQSLLVLANLGIDLNEYTPWVWRNLQALQIQALTPMQRGFSTYGDLDSYNNFSVEPNSMPIRPYLGGLVAMHMGLLARAGEREQAQNARWHVDNLYSKRASAGGWAMLLFASDELRAKPDHQVVATSYADMSGGLFFDRTSWNTDASFFVARAGWGGVDHAHEDAGSFQLYRKGVWLTHESLGYNGPAAEAQAHNVPALEISFADRGTRVGQFNMRPNRAARITSTASTPDYALVTTDLLGAYSAGRFHSMAYEEVERHLFWLKPNATNDDDRLFVYDRIVSKSNSPKEKRAWQFHLDEKPLLKGARASYQAGSQVDVQVVLPAGLKLAYEGSQGTHSKDPGQRYTARLVADAKSKKKDLRYLAVVRASDSKIVDEVVAVESEQVVGALAGSDLVLFPRHAASATHKGPLVVSLDISAMPSIWWTGLEANSSYGLESDRRGDTLTLTLTPSGNLKTNSAGVLTLPRAGS